MSVYIIRKHFIVGHVAVIIGLPEYQPDFLPKLWLLHELFPQELKLPAYFQSHPLVSYGIYYILPALVKYPDREREVAFRQRQEPERCVLTS